MAQYQKSNPVIGKWVKGSEVKPGTKCKLMSETTPQPSQFFNKDGSVKMQQVARVKLQGQDEELNVSLNRATIDGLVEAFGPESRDWQENVLVAETEKVRVAGKMQTVLYLIPEGYELINDERGFAHIVPQGNKVATIDLEAEPEPAGDW